MFFTFLATEEYDTWMIAEAVTVSPLLNRQHLHVQQEKLKFHLRTKSIFPEKITKNNVNKDNFFTLSHAGREARWVHHFGTNISTTVGWIIMKSCADIHVFPMKPTDSGDPLTFPLAPNSTKLMKFSSLLVALLFTAN